MDKQTAERITKIAAIIMIVVLILSVILVAVAPS
jgi:hypothetical protein